MLYDAKLRTAHNATGLLNKEKINLEARQGDRDGPKVNRHAVCTQEALLQLHAHCPSQAALTSNNLFD